MNENSNPSRDSWDSSGNHSNRGESFQNKERSVESHNDKGDSLAHQLDDSLQEMVRNPETGKMAPSSSCKEGGHVALETGGQRSPRHVPMHPEILMGFTEVARTHEELQGEKENQHAPKELTLVGTNLSSIQARPEMEGMGDVPTAMVTDDGNGNKVGLEGGSVRKWKRKARGKEQRLEAIQVNGKGVRKRSGTTDDQCSGMTVTRKKSRTVDQKVAKSPNDLAAAVEQPRPTQ